MGHVNRLIIVHKFEWLLKNVLSKILDYNSNILKSWGVYKIVKVGKYIGLFFSQTLLTYVLFKISEPQNGM